MQSNFGHLHVEIFSSWIENRDTNVMINVISYPTDENKTFGVNMYVRNRSLYLHAECLCIGCFQSNIFARVTTVAATTFVLSNARSHNQRTAHEIWHFVVQNVLKLWTVVPILVRNPVLSGCLVRAVQLQFSALRMTALWSLLLPSRSIGNTVEYIYNRLRRNIYIRSEDIHGSVIVALTIVVLHTVARCRLCATDEWEES